MIQPRSISLVRTSDPVRYWSQLIVVERHNVTGTASGTWSVTARNEGLRGLLVPGAGVILTRSDVSGSVVVMSGPVTSIQRGATVSTVSGVSDADILSGRIIYPDPTKAITAQPAAYDNRSGPAETVLLGYVNANIGPGALTSRRVNSLRVPASQGRGKNVSIKGRLDLLSNTVGDVSESGSLHVDVVHGEDTAPYLGMTVRPVRDLTANIRFGAATNFTAGLVGDDWSYTLSRPTVTDAIVAGGGQGVNRLFVEKVDVTAETLWGMKVESLIDQRQTTDTAELTQAGTDALADGANPVAVSFTVTETADIKYRQDWRVGDRIGVSIDGMDLSNVVREVTTTVQTQAGSPTETVAAMVGSRDSSNWTTKTNADVARALRQLQALQAI
ncbi:Gp37-like protein [Curtobacterium sp. PhB172]|uniref:Gp37-like protein n=1 Tax=Curtobacterium sp. PhB172 TaxID=2485196 RepID=UPI00161F9981|nr:siphovirus ReqiPepy6 Gp37-like family protein [Curtobacterium sp. PhB172]